jgi:hypothetical protein
MLQVAAFLVPTEQEKANEFLRTHRIAPEGINFNTDRLIIFYDDDPVAELVQLLDSVGKARFQQEVALHVLKAELADLNSVKNKVPHETKQPCWLPPTR